MKLFQKVRLQGCFPQGIGTTGKVVGQCSFVSSKTKEACEGFIVELDEGFFNQGKNLYVNMLAVRCNEVEEIDDPVTVEKVDSVLSAMELDNLFVLPSSNG